VLAAGNCQRALSVAFPSDAMLLQTGHSRSSLRGSHWGSMGPLVPWMLGMIPLQSSQTSAGAPASIRAQRDAFWRRRAPPRTSSTLSTMAGAPTAAVPAPAAPALATPAPLPAPATPHTFTRGWIFRVLRGSGDDTEGMCDAGLRATGRPST